jgi:hypothetical protein
MAVPRWTDHSGAVTVAVAVVEKVN